MGNEIQSMVLPEKCFLANFIGLVTSYIRKVRYLQCHLRTHQIIFTELRENEHTDRLKVSDQRRPWIPATSEQSALIDVI